MDSNKEWRVFVPSRNTRLVTYPSSGYPLYTREEAMAFLKLLFSRCRWDHGDALEPWAECATRRFTLEFYLKKEED